MAQWPPSSEIAPRTGTIVSSSETPAAPEGLTQLACGRRSERASPVPCPWRRRRERHTSGASAPIWGSPAAGPRANGQHPYAGGRRIASCTSGAAPDRRARTLPGAPAALRPRTLRRVLLLPPDRGRYVGGPPSPPASFCRGHWAWPLWPPHRGVWTTSQPLGVLAGHRGGHVEVLNAGWPPAPF